MTLHLWFSTYWYLEFVESLEPQKSSFPIFPVRKGLIMKTKIYATCTLARFEGQKFNWMQFDRNSWLITTFTDPATLRAETLKLTYSFLHGNISCIPFTTNTKVPLVPLIFKIPQDSLKFSWKPWAAGHQIRGKSRTAGTSKMELFVTIVNGWKPLTIITKSYFLDIAAALYLPLPTQWRKSALVQKRYEKIPKSIS